MINSFKNPAIMRILRTTERYEAGWREQNFISNIDEPRLFDFEQSVFSMFKRKSLYFISSKNYNV